MELIHRVACAEATLAQYKDVRFQYGKFDCVRMAVHHLRRMGHKIALAPGGSYRTANSAAAALKRAGFASLEAALDDRFDRIAPAAAWAGDVIALPSSGPLSALSVRMSNNAVLHALNGGFVVSEPVAFVAAWRVPYLGGARG